MLSLDNIINSNSGGVAAATSSAAVVVSLATGTTEADSTLMVLISAGNSQTITTPAGWIRPTTVGQTTDCFVYFYYRGPAQGLIAGESSWNFTPVSATAGPVRWTVLEFAGLDVETPVDVIGGSSSWSSGTQAGMADTIVTTYDGMAVSVHASYNDTGTPDTWSNYDGPPDFFTEVAQGGQAGTGAVSLAVSMLPVRRIEAYGTNADCSRTFTSARRGYSLTVVFTAQDARRAADLVFSDGAEHGTIVGNTLGVANYKILETVTAGVSVSAAAKRSGDYGWLLASTAAACNFTMHGGTLLGSLGQRPVLRRCFRFPTLPAADTAFWVLTAVTGSTPFTFRYVTATGKIGLKIGSGTEVFSDQSITADQYFAIDVRMDMRATTYLADWLVDYNAGLTDTTPSVAQTQVSGTGSASNSLATYQVGWATALTATLHTDDGAASANRAHYPLGDLRILPVKVDPAGTATVLTATTNFGVMTNNGSVAAWDATNARNAVDDIPPDLSATRDAAVVLLAQGADYAQFPMDTIDLAGTGVELRGVRFVVPLWAASGTAATIRMFFAIFWDGTTVSTTLFPEADPTTDNSATPAWVARQARPATGRIPWDQLTLDTLAFRFSSNDATPDIGVDAILAEVAVVKAQPEVLFGSPGDAAYVEAKRDPDTNGLIGMQITTVGVGATVDYEVNGVPQTEIVVAADATHYEPIGAADFPTVNRIDLTPG